MATSAAAAKSAGVARPKRKTREERIDAALRATARAAAAQLAREGLTLPAASWTHSAKDTEDSQLAEIVRKRRNGKTVKVALGNL